MGWARVTLTGAGRESPLAPLAKGAPVLHWHGDTFDLPHGAQCLASTRLYQNQAFAWGACALGLQFHLEADAATLEAWFVGHAAEIAATAGVTVEKLRDDTKRYAPAVADVADDILSSWLRGVRYTPAVRYSS
jgi:GMP synthase (glutamine-hydrolysing)